MKKITFLLPLFICFFVFSSCKKCKDCSCSQVVSQTGMPDVNQTIEINDVFDEDLEEIEGATTITQVVDGFTQNIEQTCDCN
ncbi:MAG: hypothetical protein ISP73_03455 [Flavobacteriales bacterium]|nr:hypothetical protein [Flavobacteriales bacterium]